LRKEKDMRKFNTSLLAGLAVTSLLNAGSGVWAHDDKVRAKLSGFQEVPVVSTVGSGEFRALISGDEQRIDWELTYEGMQGTVTQAHIHIAQRGVNGGIVLWLCGTTITTPPTPGPAGTAVCTSPSGHFSGTFTPASVQDVATQQFATGELDEVIAAIRRGLAYANVHTEISPAGEIRGQLRDNRDDD
jgi:hypothetical protein